MPLISESNHQRLWHPNFPVQPRKSPVFYGWVIVGIATIGTLGTIPGQTMGMGVFTDSLIEALSMSRVDLSLAYLLGTVGSGLLLPTGGRLLDAWGIRRCAFGSAVAMGLSLYFLANCDRLARAVVPEGSRTALVVTTFVIVTFGFFLVRFFGQGMLSISCRNMIGKWFHHRRGLAIAISGITVSFLFAASPAVLNHFVQSIGWRWTWIWLGTILLFGIAGMAWALFRDNPEECGLSMDGGYVPPVRTKVNPDLIFKRDITREEAFRMWSFWIPTLSFGWSAFFATGYTFHVLSIGESIGMDRAEILSLFLYGSGFAITANLACGWASARTRVKYILAVMNLMSTLYVASLIFSRQPWTSLGIVVGMGIAGGLWNNLSGLIFPRFFGRVYLGALTGVFMGVTVFASACGPYVFSLFHAVFGDYRMVFSICVFFPLALTWASLRVENPQRRLE